MIVVVLASATLSGTVPPVGCSIEEPTNGGTGVGGSASVSQYSFPRAWDVVYGRNRCDEVCPVLVGPELDWFDAYTFCRRKVSAKKWKGNQNPALTKLNVPVEGPLWLSPQYWNGTVRSG